jgi:hypothetical protein
MTGVKYIATALAAFACLASTQAVAQDLSNARRTYMVRYMEEVSCKSWLHGGVLTGYSRDAALNWVLGYMSRASVARGQDLLGPQDQTALALWMDDFCSREPDSNILTGANRLEKELATPVSRSAAVTK